MIFKSTVAKSGHLKRVLDERNILAEMNSPFIMSFNGSFQTKDDLIIVTELINGNCMWSLIYDKQTGKSQGLSLECVRFCAANIIFGLSHIHEKGVVYRGNEEGKKCNFHLYRNNND